MNLDSLILGKKVWMRQAGIGWGQFTITQVPNVMKNNPHYFFSRERNPLPTSAAPVVDTLLHSVFVENLLDRGYIRENPPWVGEQT